MAVEEETEEIRFEELLKHTTIFSKAKMNHFLGLVPRKISEIV